MKKIKTFLLIFFMLLVLFPRASYSENSKEQEQFIECYVMYVHYGKKIKVVEMKASKHRVFRGKGESVIELFLFDKKGKTIFNGMVDAYYIDPECHFSDVINYKSQDENYIYD